MFWCFSLEVGGWSPDVQRHSITQQSVKLQKMKYWFSAVNTFFKVSGGDSNCLSLHFFYSIFYLQLWTAKNPEAVQIMHIFWYMRWSESSNVKPYTRTWIYGVDLGPSIWIMHQVTVIWVPFIFTVETWRPRMRNIACADRSQQAVKTDSRQTHRHLPKHLPIQNNKLKIRIFSTVDVDLKVQCKMEP